MRQGPSAKAIAKWEAEASENFEAKVESVSATAVKYLVDNKVVASAEVLPQFFYKHIKSCIVNFVAYHYAGDGSARRAEYSAAARKIAAAKAKIDSIGAHEVETYVLGAKRRGRPDINIFSKSILLSMDDAISDFKRRANARPGPRERVDIGSSVECAVEAFEAAAGREFKRNFRIHGSLKSPQSDFVTIDAKFVETVLKAVSPGVSKSSVKTALLKLPPRRSGDLAR